MQKKVWSRGPGRTPGTKGPRSRGPGRTGPRDLEGPVVLAGQDLETLKVPGLENWKSPGTKGYDSYPFKGPPSDKWQLIFHLIFSLSPFPQCLS